MATTPPPPPQLQYGGFRTNGHQKLIDRKRKSR